MKTSVVELLKKSAEHYLKDMVQFLFSRLPEFSEDDRISLNKVNMNFKHFTKCKP